MGVNWSELPPDIIESISKRLTIYADYLRFRCVCRSWYSSVPKIPLHHIPPQLPWLMLSHNSFYNLSNNKIHCHNLLPRSGLTRICGSSHGWLVILKQTSELTLLNPITRATLSLPSLNTYPDLVAKLFNHNNNLHLIKVVLSSSPSSLSDDDDFVAFAILNRSDLIFCKKGYNSWVLLNHASKNNHKWIDVVYKNGSFFVLSCSGKIAVCDIEGCRVFLHENISKTFLFISRCYTVFVGEDILLVNQYCDDMWMRSNSKVTRFKIFKMNWNVLK